MENTIIVEVGLILFSGIVFGRLAKFIKLPNVTGYLVAGLLLGPSVFNLIPISMVHGFSVISDLALAFIAFSIGSEFNLKYFKEVGPTPIIIAIAESFGAIIFVSGFLLLFGFDARLSIMLGAIAAATAPAQTIMVIRQYGAKGKLTSMLMRVVALDDVFALVGFGFAATIAGLLASSGDNNILHSIVSPFVEIVVSFVLGFVLSAVMKLFFRWFKKPSNRICIISGAIMLTYWLAAITDASSLLACMALGGILVNIIDDIESVTKTVDGFTPPIFMLFFVISGAGFDITKLASVGVIGLLYVVLRVAGKMFGAWFGGTVTKQDKSVRLYLGPALMPQAGVALGLIVVASSVVPEYASQIRVIVLCSTFIYSVIGPIAAKFSLIKAGDIEKKTRKKRAISKAA